MKKPRSVRDDPPRFTLEMAKRGRHMMGDREVVFVREVDEEAIEAISRAEPPERSKQLNHLMKDDDE